MLSRIISGVIIGGIILSAAALIDANSAQADTRADFIPISVLADNQADYGVDDNLRMIPSISLDLIADKLQDEGQIMSSLPVIFFTSGSPSSDDKSTDEADDLGENIADKPGHEQGGNNGNGNGNGNGLGNEKSEEKGKNGKGSGNNGKQDQNKDNSSIDSGKGKPTK